MSNKKLVFDNPHTLQLLIGDEAEHRRLVEHLAGLGVHIDLREEGLHVEGDQAPIVVKALKELSTAISRGSSVNSRDVVRAVEAFRSEPETNLEALFQDVVTHRLHGKGAITPRSLSQKRYVDAMRRYHLVFGVGPAGTGKTYLAMAMAVRRYLDKQVKRIILARPAIEAGENLGFLPGTFEEKVGPYMRPLYDALFDMIEPPKVQRMTEQGIIEIAPLAYMRGRTLSDAFVILDEAQNATREQMKMLLTRIGNGTWAVITGDPSQVDLPGGKKSGLAHALDVLRPVESVAQCRFTHGDVMRHPLVQDIVRAYDTDERLRSER